METTAKKTTKKTTAKAEVILTMPEKVKYLADYIDSQTLMSIVVQGEKALDDAMQQVKEELAALEKAQESRKESLNAFEGAVKVWKERHSGCTTAEATALAVIREFLVKGQALPEPGQKKSFKDQLLKAIPEFTEKDSVSWEGNTNLLASGAIIALRLVGFLTEQGIDMQNLISGNAACASVKYSHKATKTK
jgi:hypothetical protein